MNKNSAKEEHKPSPLTRKVNILWLIPSTLVSAIIISLVYINFYGRPNNNANSSNSSSAKFQVTKNQNEPGNGTYKYINPILECTGELYEPVPFRDKVDAYIRKCKREGLVTNVSVFFRGMDDGYQFGINEYEDFYPASLIKVPTMMGYLREAIDTPALMDRKIYFAGPAPGALPNHIPNPMAAGHDYSVRDLIERMIIYSDNDATVLLNKNLSNESYNRTCSDLGIEVPDYTRPDQNYINVYTYVRILRILYNSSYLNHEMSDYALKLLSQVYFADGIVKGSKNDSTSTNVAHKYGEWYYNGVYQLHDCGIVYLPNKTYALGIMTKGKDVHKLAEVIAGISKIVYQSASQTLKDDAVN